MEVSFADEKSIVELKSMLLWQSVCVNATVPE